MHGGYVSDIAVDRGIIANQVDEKPGNDMQTPVHRGYMGRSQIA